MWHLNISHMNMSFLNHGHYIPTYNVSSKSISVVSWSDLYMAHCGLIFLQMTKMLHVFLVLALLGLGSGDEGARLLASKSLLNRYAVEGRDLTLQYNIYNVGSRSEGFY